MYTPRHFTTFRDLLDAGIRSWLSFWSHCALTGVARTNPTRFQPSLGHILPCVGCITPKVFLVTCVSQVKSVYVGNLPEVYDEAKLRAVFEVYGKVSSELIIETAFVWFGRSERSSWFTLSPSFRHLSTCPCIESSISSSTLQVLQL